MIVPTDADQVTPALGVMSFETVAANVWVAPATMATGVVVIETAIGVRVTVAEADLLGSVLLVAVTVTVVTVTTEGAEYTAVELFGLITPTPTLGLTLQVAPEFSAVSPVMDTVKVWVAEAISVAVVGLRLMATGVKVTVAVAVFVVSDLLVAVMVAAVVGTGAGAV